MNDVRERIGVKNFRGAAVVMNFKLAVVYTKGALDPTFDEVGIGVILSCSSYRPKKVDIRLDP